MLRESELQILCYIAEAAGAQIMDVYRNGGASFVKDDTSPLTEADLRADKIIRAGLEKSFPGIFILSEESRSQTQAAGDRFFLVDPLDGTKEFLKRNDEFTVNIALVEKGEAVAGVVLAPALGQLYYAAKYAGAWRRDSSGLRAIRTAPFERNKILRVTGSRSHGDDRLAQWLAGLPCAHTFAPAGSSLKFCRVAEGAADAYPRFGPTSQWDTAAAQCVLEAAGGAVLDLQGRPLAYGLDRPVLNPEFMALARGEMLGVLGFGG